MRIFGARNANIMSARMFGAVNQNSPAKPYSYAIWTETNSAGAQIHDAAILELPFSQPIFRLARRKSSFRESVFLDFSNRETRTMLAPKIRSMM